MTNTWLNSDGLYIKYGPAEATVTTGGQYHDEGSSRVVEVDIAALSALSATAGATILADNVLIPNGAFITRVDLITTTAATGSSSALNVGLVDQDRSTQIDFDGLIAAAALTTIDAIGETTSFTVGTTAAGALIGTKITNTGLLVADYDTAVFTAGAVKIRIFFFMQS